MDFVPIPSQTVGPYFHLGLTEKHSAACIASSAANGERVWVTCRVFDGDGALVDDAMIEVWQADSEGKYNHPDDLREKQSDPGCNGFGRLGTAADGSCRFETIKPGSVPGRAGVPQVPHLNLAVFARGLLNHLYTRIYFAGDPGNEKDPVLGLVPQERRGTLMAQPDPARSGHWCFDIHLCGELETVFFDV
jgi:protocatechuate 3,4-dioxygenase, alpha subunit